MTDRSSSSRPSEAGFTIVESTVAMGLVFTVLVGLLSSLPTGLRGVITGRQRATAVAMASEVLEQARARGYAEVGHDLDSDPTLATDPDLAGGGVEWVHTAPEPDEPLAASSIDAGTSAGSTDNPLHPFSPHRWTTEQEGTTYTTTVYVTLVRPEDAGPYKRVSVIVGWDRAQHREDTIAPEVRLSSFLFDAVPAAQDVFNGVADATGGSITATGQLGADPVDARLFLPYAHGEVDARFVTAVRGYAGTARTQLDGATGSGAKAESSADDDSGAAPFEHDRVGPIAHPGTAAGVGTALATTVGAGSAASASTARSCWVCHAPDGDDDRLPHQASEAGGPGLVTMDFRAGSVTGALARAASVCVAECATAVIDRDDAGALPTVTSVASVAAPAMDVGVVDGAPPGFAGMVRVGAAAVTARAEAGVGADPPSAAGPPVTVEIYDGTAYKQLAISPGTAMEEAGHAEVPVGDALVVMDAVVRTTPAAVSSTPGGSAVAGAEAALTSWLQVELHLVVIELLTTVADVVVLVDYGQVASRAAYEAA